MVKYCVANECPINEWACANAAQNGHLEVLKYLREEAEAPWDWYTASWAAGNGHLHILEYLVERKYDKYNEDACELAAENGHLDCLKYLHETAKAPWNYLAVRFAHTRTTTTFTIPPRQRLSSTTRLAIRARSTTRNVVIIITIIVNLEINRYQRERHADAVKALKIYSTQNHLNTLQCFSPSFFNPQQNEREMKTSSTAHKSCAPTTFRWKHHHHRYVTTKTRQDASERAPSMKPCSCVQNEAQLEADNKKKKET